jgi:hypothetical protein
MHRKTMKAGGKSRIPQSRRSRGIHRTVNKVRQSIIAPSRTYRLSYAHPIMRDLIAKRKVTSKLDKKNRKALMKRGKEGAKPIIAKLKKEAKTSLAIKKQVPTIYASYDKLVRYYNQGNGKEFTTQLAKFKAEAEVLVKKLSGKSYNPYILTGLMGANKDSILDRLRQASQMEKAYVSHKSTSASASRAERAARRSAARIPNAEMGASAAAGALAAIAEENNANNNDNDPLLGILAEKLQKSMVLKHPGNADNNNNNNNED